MYEMDFLFVLLKARQFFINRDVVMVGCGQLVTNIAPDRP